MATHLVAARIVLQRGLLLSGLWWVLTGGAPGSWIVGAPAILAGAYVSERLLPRSPVNILQLLLFVPRFLLRSLLAAFDVARRTLAPRQAIDPGLLTFETRLSAGIARVVFMDTVSLLPGTLCAAHDDHTLTVHVLDCGQDHAPRLAALEANIARIFPGSLRG